MSAMGFEQCGVACRGILSPPLNHSGKLTCCLQIASTGHQHGQSKVVDTRDRWSFECGAALPRILVELLCAARSTTMLALLCQTARAHLWHLCVARHRAGAPPRSALHNNASVACAPPLAPHKTWSRTRRGLKKKPGVQAHPVWRGQSTAFLSYVVTPGVSYGVRTHAHLRAVDLKSTPLPTRANWLLPADRQCWSSAWAKQRAEIRDRRSFACGAALPRILVGLLRSACSTAMLALLCQTARAHI